MALVLNDTAKYGSTVAGASLLGSFLSQASINNVTFRIHSSAVPYSITNITTGVGVLCSVSNVGFSLDTVSKAIIFPTGTSQLTPSASGTAAWWSLASTTITRRMMSDSISTFSGSGILRLSTLDLVSGTPFLAMFSFSFT